MPKVPSEFIPSVDPSIGQMPSFSQGIVAPVGGGRVIGEQVNLASGMSDFSKLAASLGQKMQDEADETFIKSEETAFIKNINSIIHGENGYDKTAGADSENAYQPTLSSIDELTKKQMEKFTSPMHRKLAAHFPMIAEKALESVHSHRHSQLKQSTIRNSEARIETFANEISNTTDPSKIIEYEPVIRNEFATQAKQLGYSDDWVASSSASVTRKSFQRLIMNLNANGQNDLALSLVKSPSFTGMHSPEATAAAMHEHESLVNKARAEADRARQLADYYDRKRRQQVSMVEESLTTNIFKKNADDMFAMPKDKVDSFAASLRDAYVEQAVKGGVSRDKAETDADDMAGNLVLYWAKARNAENNHEDAWDVLQKSKFRPAMNQTTVGEIGNALERVEARMAAKSRKTAKEILEKAKQVVATESRLAPKELIGKLADATGDVDVVSFEKNVSELVSAISKSANIPEDAVRPVLANEMSNIAEENVYGILSNRRERLGADYDKALTVINRMNKAGLMSNERAFSIQGIVFTHKQRIDTRAEAEERKKLRIVKERDAETRKIISLAEQNADGVTKQILSNLGEYSSTQGIRDAVEKIRMNYANLISQAPEKEEKIKGIRDKQIKLFLESVYNTKIADGSDPDAMRSMIEHDDLGGGVTAKNYVSSTVYDKITASREKLIREDIKDSKAEEELMNIEIEANESARKLELKLAQGVAKGTSSMSSLNARAASSVNDVIPLLKDIEDKHRFVHDSDPHATNELTLSNTVNDQLEVLQWYAYSQMAKGNLGVIDELKSSDNQVVRSLMQKISPEVTIRHKLLVDQKKKAMESAEKRGIIEADKETKKIKETLIASAESVIQKYASLGRLDNFQDAIMELKNITGTLAVVMSDTDTLKQRRERAFTESLLSEYVYSLLSSGNIKDARLLVTNRGVIDSVSPKKINNLISEIGIHEASEERKKKYKDNTIEQTRSLAAAMNDQASRNFIAGMTGGNIKYSQTYTPISGRATRVGDNVVVSVENNQPITSVATGRVDDIIDGKDAGKSVTIFGIGGAKFTIKGLENVVVEKGQHVRIDTPIGTPVLKDGGSSVEVSAVDGKTNLPIDMGAFHVFHSERPVDVTAENIEQLVSMAPDENRDTVRKMLNAEIAQKNQTKLNVYKENEDRYLKLILSGASRDSQEVDSIFRSTSPDFQRSELDRTQRQSEVSFKKTSSSKLNMILATANDMTPDDFEMYIRSNIGELTDEHFRYAMAHRRALGSVSSDVRRMLHVALNMELAKPENNEISNLRKANVSQDKREKLYVIMSNYWNTALKSSNHPKNQAEASAFAANYMSMVKRSTSFGGVKHINKSIDYTVNGEVHNGNALLGPLEDALAEARNNGFIEKINDAKVAEVIVASRKQGIKEDVAAAMVRTWSRYVGAQYMKSQKGTMPMVDIGKLQKSMIDTWIMLGKPQTTDEYIANYAAYKAGRRSF